MIARAHDYAQALFEAVSEDRKNTQALVAHFLDSLRQSKKMTLLPVILDQLELIEAETLGKVAVVVTTAEPLLDSQSAALVQELEASLGKKIELTRRLDPSLIGGLTIKIGDTIIDHSVKTKLAVLAENLHGGLNG